MLGAFKRSLLVKVVCWQSASILLTTTILPPVWASEKRMESIHLAPASTFEKKSGGSRGIPFPLASTFHRPGEPMEQIYQGALDNLMGLSYVHGGDLGEQFLEEFESFSAHPVGSSQYESNKDEERFKAYLLTMAKDSAPWRAALGMPLPAHVSELSQQRIQNAFAKTEAADLKTAAERLEALEKLTRENISQAERAQVYADLSALTEAQRAAAKLLIRHTMAESRVTFTYFLMAHVLERERLSVGSEEYRKNNEKTLIRLLLSFSRQAFAGLEVEKLLEDPVDGAVRSEIFRRLRTMPPQDRAVLYYRLAEGQDRQLQKLADVIRAIVEQINRFNPDVMPRVVRLSLVANASLPVLMDLQGCIEADMESLLGSMPVGVVGIFHSARNRLMHSRSKMVSYLRGYDPAAEEIINILFDHVFINQPIVAYLEPNLKDSFLRDLNRFGAGDYAQLLTQLDAGLLEERAGKVFEYLMSRKELRERFENLTQEDQPRIVQQAVNALTEMAMMPIADEKDRMFVQFARAAAKGPFTLVLGIFPKLDWNELYAKLDPQGAIQDILPALHTLDEFMSGSPDWTPGSNLIGRVMDLATSEAAMVRQYAQHILTVGSTRKAFPMSPAELYSEMLRRMDGIVEKLEEPKDEKTITDAGLHATVLMELSGIVRGILQAHPQVVAQGANQALTDQLAQRLAVTALTIADEKDSDSLRAKILAPRSFDLLVMHLNLALEPLMPGVSTGKVMVLEATRGCFVRLLSHITKVFSDLQTHGPATLKYGLPEEAEHLSEMSQCIECLVRINPLLRMEPRAEELLAEQVDLLLNLAQILHLRIQEEEGHYLNYSLEDLMRTIDQLTQTAYRLHGAAGKPTSDETNQRLVTLSLFVLNRMALLHNDLLAEKQSPVLQAYGHPSLLACEEHSFRTFKLLKDWRPEVFDAKAQGEFSRMHTTALSTYAMRCAFGSYSELLKIPELPELVQRYLVEDFAAIQSVGNKLLRNYRSIHPAYLSASEQRINFPYNLFAYSKAAGDMVRAMSRGTRKLRANNVYSYMGFLMEGLDWMDVVLEDIEHQMPTPDALRREYQRVLQNNQGQPTETSTALVVQTHAIEETPKQLNELVKQLGLYIQTTADGLKKGRGTTGGNDIVEICMSITHACDALRKLTEILERHKISHPDNARELCKTAESLMETAWGLFDDAVHDGPLSKEYQAEAVLSIAHYLYKKSGEIFACAKQGELTRKMAGLHQNFAAHPQYFLGHMSKAYLEELIGKLPVQTYLEFAEGARDLAKTQTALVLAKSQRSLIEQVQDSLLPENKGLKAALVSIRDAHPALFEQFVSRPVWKIEVVEGYYRPVEARPDHRLLIDRRMLADPDLLAFLLIGEWIKDLSATGPLEKEMLAMRACIAQWDDMAFDRPGVQKKLASYFPGATDFIGTIEKYRRLKDEGKRTETLREFVQGNIPRLKFERWDAQAFDRVKALPRVLMGAWVSPPADAILIHPADATRVQLVRVRGPEHWVLFKDGNGDVLEASSMIPDEERSFTTHGGPSIVVRVPPLESPMAKIVKPLMAQDNGREECIHGFEAFVHTWIVKEVQAMGVRGGKIPNPGELENLVHKVWKPRAQAALGNLTGQALKEAKQALEEEANAKHRILSILLHLQTTYFGKTSEEGNEDLYVLATAMEFIKRRQPALLQKELKDVTWEDLQPHGLGRTWGDELINLVNELVDTRMLWDRALRNVGKLAGPQAVAKEPLSDFAKQVAAEIQEQKNKWNKGRYKVEVFRKPNVSGILDQLERQVLPPAISDVVTELQLARSVDTKVLNQTVRRHIQKLLSAHPEEDWGDVLIRLSDDDFKDLRYEKDNLDVPLLKAMQYAGMHWSDIVLGQYRGVVVGQYSIGWPRKIAKWMMQNPIPRRWQYRSYGLYEEVLFDAIKAFTEVLTDYSTTDATRHSRQTRITQGLHIDPALKQPESAFVFRPEYFDILEKSAYIPGLAQEIRNAGITADDINEQLFGIEKVDYKNRDFRRKFITRKVEALREEGGIETILDLTPADFPPELFTDSGLGLTELLMENYSHLSLVSLGIHRFPELESLRPFLVAAPDRWNTMGNRIEAVKLMAKRFNKRPAEMKAGDLFGDALLGTDTSGMLKALQEDYSGHSMETFLKENPPDEPLDAGRLVRAVGGIAHDAPHVLALAEAGILDAGNFQDFRDRYNARPDKPRPIRADVDDFKLLVSYLRLRHDHQAWKQFEGLVHLATRKRLSSEEREQALARATYDLTNQILVRQKIRDFALRSSKRDMEFSSIERVQARVHEMEQDKLVIRVQNHFRGSVLYVNPGDTVNIFRVAEDAKSKIPFSMVNEQNEIVDTFTVADAGENFISISLKGMQKAGRDLVRLKDQKGIVQLAEVAMDRADMIEKQILEQMRAHLAGHGRSLKRNARIVDQFLRVESPAPVDLKASYKTALARFDRLVETARLGNFLYKDLPIFQRLRLDPSQMAAVLLSLIPKMPVLYHGPPGTGKTTVITAVILLHMAMAEQENRPLSVLMCSQANPAVDNVLLSLIDVYQKAGIMAPKDYPFRRIAGSLENVDKEIAKNYRYLCLKSSDERISQFMAQHPRHILFATNMGTKTNASICKLPYGLVIMDEDTKANMSESLAPLIALGWSDESGLVTDVQGATDGKVIKVGDHKQLPPYALEDWAIEAAGLTQDEEQALLQSLFQTLMESGHDQVLLSRNYRSRPPIAVLVSRLFYDGAIVPRDFKQDKDEDGQPIVHERTFTLIDTARIRRPGYYTVSVPDQKLRSEIMSLRKNDQSAEKSWANPLEARLVVDQVYALLKRGKGIEDILVIPFHRPQLALIQQLLAEYLEAWYRSDPQIRSQLEKLDEYARARTEWLRQGGQDLNTFAVGRLFFEELVGTVVKTVDSSQGLEEKIVIVPFARSNPRGVIGFLKDLNRLNVALSRGQEELIVIGDSETLHAASQTRKDVRARKKFQALWDFEKEFQGMLAHYKINVLERVAQAHAVKPMTLGERIGLFSRKYGDKESRLFMLIQRMQERLVQREPLDAHVLNILAREAGVPKGSLDWFVATWLLFPADASRIVQLAVESSDSMMWQAAQAALRALPPEPRKAIALRLLSERDLNKLFLAVGLLETVGDPNVVPKLLELAERSPPLARKIRFALNRISATQSFKISRKLYDRMRIPDRDPRNGSGILLKGGLFLRVEEPPEPLSDPYFRRIYPELVKTHFTFLGNLLRKDIVRKQAIGDALIADNELWKDAQAEFANINPIAEDLRSASPLDWSLRMLAFHLALRRVVKAPDLKRLPGRYAQAIGKFMEIMYEATESDFVVRKAELPRMLRIDAHSQIRIYAAKDPHTSRDTIAGRYEHRDPKTGIVQEVSFIPANIQASEFRIGAVVSPDGTSITLSGLLKSVFHSVDKELPLPSLAFRGPPFPVRKVGGPRVLLADLKMNLQDNNFQYTKIYRRSEDLDPYVERLWLRLRDVAQIMPDFIPKKLNVRLLRNLPHPVLVNEADNIIEVDADSLMSDHFLVMTLALYHDVNHFKLNAIDKVVEEVLTIRDDMNFIWRWELVRPEVRPALMQQLTEARGEDYAILLQELEGRPLEKQVHAILDFIHERRDLHKRLLYDPANPRRDERLREVQEAILGNAPKFTVLTVENFHTLPWGVFQTPVGFYETLQYPFVYWQEASSMPGQNLKLVRDLRSGQIKVLKLLRQGEAPLYAKLDSPNWIRPVEVGGNKERPIVEMPFIGDPFKIGPHDPYEIIHYLRSLPVSDRIPTWTKIVDAVRHLHRHAGLFYGLKFIDNVRMTVQGQPVFLDLHAATPLTTHLHAARDIKNLNTLLKEIFPDLYFPRWDNPTHPECLREWRSLTSDPRQLVNFYVKDIENALKTLTLPVAERVNRNVRLLICGELPKLVQVEVDAGKIKDGYAQLRAAVDYGGCIVQIISGSLDFSQEKREGLDRRDLVEVILAVKVDPAAEGPAFAYKIPKRSPHMSAFIPLEVTKVLSQTVKVANQKPAEKPAVVAPVDPPPLDEAA